ncbi:glycine zipper domain-containing protein [Flavitalea antarctica]
MKRSFFFNTVAGLLFPVLFAGFFQTVAAQAPPALPDTSKMTYNQMSNGLKLIVFPAKGQSKDQQKKDEFECYKWSMEQTGIDPLNLPKVQPAEVQSGPTGAAVGGAARGAAAGVAIGAIAGDAGKGAAIGAVAGGLAGRRAGKQAQAQANQQAQANVKSQEAEIKATFVKGFSACLEGKGYTIK